MNKNFDIISMHFNMYENGNGNFPYSASFLELNVLWRYSRAEIALRNTCVALINRSTSLGIGDFSSRIIN